MKKGNIWSEPVFWALIIATMLIIWVITSTQFGGVTDAAKETLFGGLGSEKNDINKDVFVMKPELVAGIGDLVKKINTDYVNTNCFIEYDRSGFDDTQVLFVTLKKDKLTVFRGYEKLIDKDLSNFVPCLIYGKNSHNEDLSEIFYNYYFDGLSNKITDLDYAEFNEVRLQYSKLRSERPGIVQLPNVEKTVVTEYSNGLLYRADDTHICLVADYDPLIPGCKYSDGTISKDCFVGAKRDKLPFCVEQKNVVDSILSQIRVLAIDVEYGNQEGKFVNNKDCKIQGKIDFYGNDSQIKLIKNKMQVINNGNIISESSIPEFTKLSDNQNEVTDLIFTKQDKSIFIVYKDNKISWSKSNSYVNQLNDCGEKNPEVTPTKVEENKQPTNIYGQRMET